MYDFLWLAIEISELLMFILNSLCRNLKNPVPIQIKVKHSRQG